MFYTTLNILLFFYIYKHLLSSYSIDDIDLIISTIHASVTVLISFGFLTSFISQDNFLNLMIFSCGYAIYDIWFLNSYQRRNNNMLTLHHLIIILGVSWINLYKDPFVIKMLAMNYMSEISTPFLNLSFYLYNNKLIEKDKYKNIFNISNLCLIITYFIFRILLGTYLIYYTAFYNYLYIVQVTLTLLNYSWFYKLIKKSKKF